MSPAVACGEGRVAAAAADDGEDLILMDQLLRGGDGRAVAAIVLAHELELAPVDAAGLVDLVEHDLDAVHGQLAVEIAGP